MASAPTFKMVIKSNNNNNGKIEVDLKVKTNKNNNANMPNNTNNKKRRRRPGKMTRGKNSISRTAQTFGVDSAKIQSLMECVKHTPTTPAGIDMIKAIINPCGEDPLPNLEGFVDGMGTDSALVKCRDDMLVGPPSFADNESWSLVIYTTPYLEAPIIMIRFLADSVPTLANVRNVINAMLTTEWNDSVYPLYHTAATVINNDGTGLIAYTGAPFDVTHLRPSALSSLGPEPNAAGWSWFRKFRTVYKGHTIHLNAPDLANEGRIISASSATESSVKNLRVGAASPTVNTDGTVAARYTVTPPFADNVLAIQDTNSRQDVIKKGSYGVQRGWNEPVWNEAEDVRPIWRAPEASSGNPGNNTVIPANSLLKLDGFDMNLGWTVDHIRGINYMGEIHVKHRQGIEFNVPGTSPWAPFMKPAPVADEGAMNLLRQLSSLLPHFYDSSFNDMGILGGLLSRLINGVGQPVLQHAISTGASFVRGLLGRAENAAQNRLSKYTSQVGNQGYGDRSYV